MAKLTLSAARAQLPALIERVAKGETIIITRRGKAVAKLGRFSEPQNTPKLRGSDLWVAEDFDEPAGDLWDALK